MVDLFKLCEHHSPLNRVQALTKYKFSSPPPLDQGEQGTFTLHMEPCGVTRETTNAATLLVTLGSGAGLRTTQKYGRTVARLRNVVTDRIYCQNI